MKKNDSKALQTTNAFSALADFNLNDSMSEELDGLSMTFERIRIPAGGATMFELPGEDSDEPKTVKEFSGVILWHHPLFAYYSDKYTGGSNPPDCGSFDGVTGSGNPGGDCARCPLNQFGSGENGSKACKNRRRIYILREGEVFPLILSLPTGSLKEYTKYIKRLLCKRKKSNMVVTKFSLKKATSNSGIAYSQAQFAVDRPLNAAEQAVINAMTEQIKALSASVGYDAPETVPENVDAETGEVVEPLA